MAFSPRVPAEFTPPAPLLSVGAFTWDAEQSAILGPASYVQSEQFERRLEALKRGTDAVFNVGLDQHGNVVTALLVSVQTDYAAWLGTQEVLSWLDRAVQS